MSRSEFEAKSFPERQCPNVKCKSSMVVDPEDEDFRELLMQQSA